jgi:hypothetical protein
MSQKGMPLSSFSLPEKKKVIKKNYRKTLYVFNEVLYSLNNFELQDDCRQQRDFKPDQFIQARIDEQYAVTHSFTSNLGLVIKLSSNVQDMEKQIIDICGNGPNELH